MSGKRNVPSDIWKKIQKGSGDECWNWIGMVDGCGYGMMKIKQRGYRTHRIAYELTYGDIPEGLCILHSCDNPACCNPKHLRIGTHKDNMKDMLDKGRRFKTEKENNPNHKLIQCQVDEIRILYSLGNTSYKKLGKKFHVTDVQIGNIVRKDMW